MLATTRTATRALRTTPLLRQSMVRGVATQAAGSAGSSRRQDWRRQNGRWALGAAAVALPALFYLTSSEIKLDASVNTPRDKLPEIHPSEIIKRKTGPEVWVVIDGLVYDMTKFVDSHPGGADIIMQNRSYDVTQLFKPRHPSDQLLPGHLPDAVHVVGRVVGSPEELEEIALPISQEELEEMERVEKARKEIEEKGLGGVINMKDFEKLAEKMVSKVCWAYYASAGDDEITKNANGSVYQKVLFRPRVLRKVAEADASTDLMGCPSSLPIYIAPAAMAKLGHPDGELNLTRGAGSTGIIQAISSNASCSMDEMLAEREPNQPLFYQLYVNRDRKQAEELVRKINKGKFNAIMLTADAPVGGKRERDLRLKGDFEQPAGGVSIKSDEAKGVSQAMFAGVDPDLSWDDIKWLRGITDIPIMVKGIQTVEDALMAYKAGCDGIIISNHGGRQLDTARPSLDVLLEIRRHAPQLLRPEFRMPTGLSESALEFPERLTPDDQPGKQERRFDIFIDGGVTRGTEVVKALCLGANGVGVGRGFLYAQSVAGEEGVEHAVGIFKTEIELTLRLLGANKISDLRPSMVEVKEEPPVRW